MRILMLWLSKFALIRAFCFTSYFDIGRGRLLIQCGAVIEIRFV